MITYWPHLAKVFLREKLEQRLFTGTTNQTLNTALANDDVDEPAGQVILGSLQANPTRSGIVVEIYENDPDGEDWSHEIYQSGRDESRKYSDAFGRTRNYWNRRFVISIVVFFRGVDREDASEIRGAVLHEIEGLLLEMPTLLGIKDSGGETSQFGHIVRENGREGGSKSNPFWRTKLWMEFRTLRKA